MGTAKNLNGSGPWKMYDEFSSLTSSFLFLNEIHTNLIKLQGHVYIHGLAKIVGKLCAEDTCIIAGGRVLTYDHACCPVKYNASSDWTLMTGHCFETPLFAVFTRQATEHSELLVSFREQKKIYI